MFKGGKRSGEFLGIVRREREKDLFGVLEGIVGDKANGQMCGGK